MTIDTALVPLERLIKCGYSASKTIGPHSRRYKFEWKYHWRNRQKSIEWLCGGMNETLEECHRDMSNHFNVVFKDSLPWETEPPFNK